MNLSKVRPVISRDDYVALAAFRKALRKFLSFYEEGIREVGLTPQQHQTLLAVYANPDRDWVSVGEIADSLQLKHHAAVGLVDRCQAAGLVERTHDLHDRRVVRITLTEKGRSILETVTERNISQLRMLEQLTKELEALQAPIQFGS
jgi:DNA-binding MarR family transcriptional regulator